MVHGHWANNFFGSLVHTFRTLRLCGYLTARNLIARNLTARKKKSKTLVHTLSGY